MTRGRGEGVLCAMWWGGVDWRGMAGLYIYSVWVVVAVSRARLSSIGISAFTSGPAVGRVSLGYQLLGIQKLKAGRDSFQDRFLLCAQ